MDVIHEVKEREGFKKNDEALAYIIRKFRYLENRDKKLSRIERLTRRIDKSGFKAFWTKKLVRLLTALI